MIFLGIIIVIIGITMIVKPTLIWLITESWKTYDGTEPSDIYVKSTRISGVLMTLAGIVGIIGYFL